MTWQISVTDLQSPRFHFKLQTNIDRQYSIPSLSLANLTEYMSSKRGFSFFSPQLSLLWTTWSLSQQFFSCSFYAKNLATCPTDAESSFCLFLAILGALKTETQKECCECNWANEGWYFRGQGGICLMCVVILIVFCWHMMVGWWAPKWQHIHVWHNWDLIAVLSLCRKQESLYVRKQTCFLGTIICRHFKKQLLKSLLSKFPHAKENFYYLNNYYYLMWIWILNSAFPKKYLHLIAILSPIIIL